MATEFAAHDDDRTHLLDNYRFLAERRCLKRLPTLGKQRHPHPPLELRRSISLEDSSTDTDLIVLHNADKALPMPSPLTSSLNSLCVRLRPHQLLTDPDETLARSAEEYDCDWWANVARLRPVLYRTLFAEKKEDEMKEESIDKSEFDRCKRKGRRNAICSVVDRLGYNNQLTLFVSVATEIQVNHNLDVSGY